MRDLQKDLEICNNATINWELDEFIEPAYFGDTLIAVEHLYDGYEKDATFIINAREGWPEAISRAIAAEAEVERLRKVLEGVLDGSVNSMDIHEALDGCK